MTTEREKEHASRHRSAIQGRISDLQRDLKAALERIDRLEKLVAEKAGHNG